MITVRNIIITHNLEWEKSKMMPYQEALEIIKTKYDYEKIVDDANDTSKVIINALTNRDIKLKDTRENSDLLLLCQITSAEVAID